MLKSMFTRGGAKNCEVCGKTFFPLKPRTMCMGCALAKADAERVANGPTPTDERGRPTAVIEGAPDRTPRTYDSRLHDGFAMLRGESV